MEQKNNMEHWVDAANFVKVEFLYNIDLNNLLIDKETGDYYIFDGKTITKETVENLKKWKENHEIYCKGNLFKIYHTVANIFQLKFDSDKISKERDFLKCQFDIDIHAKHIGSTATNALFQILTNPDLRKFFNILSNISDKYELLSKYGIDKDEKELNPFPKIKEAISKTDIWVLRNLFYYDLGNSKTFEYKNKNDDIKIQGTFLCKEIKVSIGKDESEIKQVFISYSSQKDRYKGDFISIFPDRKLTFKDFKKYYADDIYVAIDEIAEITLNRISLDGEKKGWTGEYESESFNRIDENIDVFEKDYKNDVFAEDKLIFSIQATEKIFDDLKNQLEKEKNSNIDFTINDKVFLSKVKNKVYSFKNGSKFDTCFLSFSVKKIILDASGIYTLETSPKKDSVHIKYERVVDKIKYSADK
ncbi:MAG: hypothetical protein IK117_11010 [Bacteroidales bacterium]|nr:hypothetical protein [Bacteroidales bacterium]